ncbi:MAG: ABC transporter permease subunit [Bacilli bacterium]|jgi:sodium transport system permease protein|nr:ABC transporter permease subunit [Bacilli bacterium]
MKNVYGIIKKELDKIFKFPRMIFSTLVLPGLLIFFIYVVMGQSFTEQTNTIEEHQTIINVVNMPESYQTILNNVENIEVRVITEEKVETVTSEIYNSNNDVLVIFDLDFDQKTMNKEKPGVRVIYNPSDNKSSVGYSIVEATLSVQKDLFLQAMGLSTDIIINTSEQVYDEQKATGSILAMLLPMFIMISIFAGGLSIGTDAIAGEKERGTLATLLMTPIKKNEIILGKIVSTATITILSALSSFIGILASLPFAKSMFDVGGTVSYQVGDYLMLFGILIVIALFAASLMLLASTIGKSTKEATMYAMPVYILAIFSSTFSMFNEVQDTSIYMYLVPVYNCTLGLKAIFAFEAELLPILLVIGSSIVYITITMFILLKMFKSERVLFAK